MHSAWAEDVKINLPALEHDKGIVCVLASPRGVCVAFVGAPAHTNFFLLTPTITSNENQKKEKHQC